MPAVFGLPHRTSIASPSIRQSIASGGSTNTSSYTLTLPLAPIGPMLLQVGVESTTVSVSSVTSTGASWYRVFRGNVSGSDMVEIWAASVYGTGTAISITLSGSVFSGCSAVEFANLPSLSGPVYCATAGPLVVPAADVLFGCGRASGNAAAIGFGGNPSFYGLMNGTNSFMWVGFNTPLMTLTMTTSGSSATVAFLPLRLPSQS